MRKEKDERKSQRRVGRISTFSRMSACTPSVQTGRDRAAAVGEDLDELKENCGLMDAR